MALAGYSPPTSILPGHPGGTQSGVVGAQGEDQLVDRLSVRGEERVAQLPLQDESDPLGHPPARPITRVAAQLQAPRRLLTEGEADEHAHGLGRIGLSDSRSSQPVPDVEGAQIPVRVVQADAPEVLPTRGGEDADRELGAKELVGGTAGAPVAAVGDGDMVVDPRHPGAQVRVTLRRPRRSGRHQRSGRAAARAVASAAHREVR